MDLELMGDSSRDVSRMICDSLMRTYLKKCKGTGSFWSCERCQQNGLFVSSLPIDWTVFNDFDFLILQEQIKQWPSSFKWLVVYYSDNPNNIEDNHPLGPINLDLVLSSKQTFHKYQVLYWILCTLTQRRVWTVCLRNRIWAKRSEIRYNETQTS